MRHSLGSSQEGGWNPTVGLIEPLSQCWWNCPPWKVGVEAIYPLISLSFSEKPAFLGSCTLSMWIQSQSGPSV